jgi:hypothetical protein
VAAKPSGKNNPDRTPDRFAAGLAFAFIVLLLATELVLTLPDEADSPSYVAQFYTEHRTFIIALQLLGVVDALLLAAYAWRLRSVDRLVAGAGLLIARGQPGQPSSIRQGHQRSQPCTRHQIRTDPSTFPASRKGGGYFSEIIE